jgi:hypothetical protein
MAGEAERNTIPEPQTSGAIMVDEPEDEEFEDEEDEGGLPQSARPPVSSVG